MIALKAHFDGKVLVPDEPVSLAMNQKVLLQIQPIDLPAEPSFKRVFGQQPGAFTFVAADFDDALPDSFWLGEASSR